MLSSILCTMFMLDAVSQLTSHSCVIDDFTNETSASFCKHMDEAGTKHHSKCNWNEKKDCTNRHLLPTVALANIKGAWE